MRVQDICPACHSPLPRSFAALMDMYEANYIRLRQLAPELFRLQGSHVSRVADGLDLHLKVVEVTRHTWTLWLSYDFGPGCEPRHRPDLTVRIYRDARQAEVLSRACRFETLSPQRFAADLDTMLLCKWRLNRFLYKWLGYLLRQGHGFRRVERAALAETTA